MKRERAGEQYARAGSSSSCTASSCAAAGRWCAWAGKDKEWLLIKKADGVAGDERGDRALPGVGALGPHRRGDARRLGARCARAARAARRRSARRRGEVDAARRQPLMLATLAEQRRSRTRTGCFEIKYDGVRVLAARDGDDGDALRPQRRRTSPRATPRSSPRCARCRSTAFVLDGEIVALDETGRPSFQRLQSAHAPDAARATSRRALARCR